MKELQDAIDEIKFIIKVIQKTRDQDKIIFETKLECANKEIDRLERLQYSLEDKLGKLTQNKEIKKDGEK